jgi:hypothetical protein
MGGLEICPCQFRRLAPVGIAELDDVVSEDYFYCVDECSGVVVSELSVGG